MEFGKHIGKGAWAFADKALPAVYALGFVFLVVRVLPEREYGAYALIQSIFLIVSALGYALAFQPLTKFAAETDENGPYIVASLTVNGIFYGVVSLLLFGLRVPLASLLDATEQSNFVHLLSYVPLLLLTSYFRSFAMSLLQAKYEIQKIFWIDAAYFLGTIGLIVIAREVGGFRTAEDMILLNVYGQGLSSVLAVILTRKLMRVKLEARRDAFRKMWDFGKYSFGSNAWYNFFSQADLLFISSSIGLVATATYSAAKNLIRIFDILSQVIQMFMLPLSSKLFFSNKQSELKSTTEKAILFSLIASLPVFMVFIIFPELLLQILYSGKYDRAAILLRVFSFLAFVVPWNATCASIVMGIGRAKAGFVITSLLFILSTILYSILTPQFGEIGTSIAYASSFSVITLVVVLYTRRHVPIGLNSVLARVVDIRNFTISRLDVTRRREP